MIQILGRNGQNGQNRNNNRSNNRSTGWNNQEEQVELVGRTPNGANKGKFQIIPLGGLGEIGKKYDYLPIRGRNHRS